MMTETALDLIEQADRCNPGAREVHIQKVVRPFCQGLGEQHLLLLLRVAMFGLITDDGPHPAVFKAIDEAIGAIRERGVMPLISIAGLHPPSRDAAVGHPVGYWSMPSVEALESKTCPMFVGRPQGPGVSWEPLVSTRGEEDPRDVNRYASTVDRDMAYRYGSVSMFGVNGRDPMKTMTPDTSPPIDTSDPSGEDS